MNSKSSLEKDRPYQVLQKLFARHPLGAPDTDTFIEILNNNSPIIRTYISTSTRNLDFSSAF